MSAKSAEGMIRAGQSPLLELAQQQLAPYKPGVVIESNTCWVHGGVGSIEYHHIVPQAYGGEHGPQVALCGNCHTGIHLLSYKQLLFDGVVSDMEWQLKLVLQFAKEWVPSSVLNSPSSRLVLIRAWALAQVVYRSRKMVEASGGDNKITQFHTKFGGSDMRMLKVLAKSYGVTQDQLVKIAIQELYTRRIGSLI